MGLNDPEALPKPRYKFPLVIFIILDDLIGNNECFKRGNCTISNLTIKHRHLGINIIFTSLASTNTSPKGFENPVVVHNKKDIDDIVKKLTSVDLIEHFMKQRADSRWKFYRGAATAVPSAKLSSIWNLTAKLVRNGVQRRAKGCTEQRLCCLGLCHRDSLLPSSVLRFAQLRPPVVPDGRGP
jgi:hypothetical protein